MMNCNTPELLSIEPLAHTIDQLSARTGIGRTKIYQEIAAGRLAAAKCGKRTVVLHVDALQWLERLRAAGAAMATGEALASTDLNAGR